jgi:hypothetical protein
MMTTLAITLIGWPGIVGSLAVSTLGIVRRDSKWLLWGAVLSIGFSWYLTGWVSPLIKTAGYLLPLLHLSGAVAVRREQYRIAWAMLLPHAAVALFLAVVVLSQ